MYRYLEYLGITLEVYILHDCIVLFYSIIIFINQKCIFSMVSRKQKKSYKGQNVTDKIEFVVVVVYNISNLEMGR